MSQLYNYLYYFLLTGLDAGLLKNGPTPASFPFLLSVLEIKHYTILQQVSVKNVHTVSGARIRTYNLLIISLLL